MFRGSIFDHASGAREGCTRFGPPYFSISFTISFCPNFSASSLMAFPLGAPSVESMYHSNQRLPVLSGRDIMSLGADTITSASNSKTIPPLTLMPPVTTVWCIWVAAERDFRFPCILMISSRYCALVT